MLDGSGNEYLVRLSDLKRYDRKREEFNVLRDIQKYGVHSPEPIDLGMIEELGICYSIVSYIEGDDAKSLLGTLNEREQYEIVEEENY